MAARASSRSLWTAHLKNGQAKKVTSKAHTRVLSLKKEYEGVILGIDPSLRKTGLAIIQFKKNTTPYLLHSESITHKPSVSFADCLANISKTITIVLKKYPIQAVALEETIFVQNYKVAQILGAARGAAIAAVALHGLAVSEYPPLRIKQAITGFGRASKEQVAKTVAHMLKMPTVLEWDEADAAATALCHAFTGI